jgi:hypothetical protein
MDGRLGPDIWFDFRHIFSTSFAKSLPFSGKKDVPAVRLTLDLCGFGGPRERNRTGWLRLRRIRKAARETGSEASVNWNCQRLLIVTAAHHLWFSRYAFPDRRT